MHEKTFGLKVLLGIVIGLAIGTVLFLYMPAGIQPGDVLEATTADGEVIRVVVPEDVRQRVPLLPVEEGLEESGFGGSIFVTKVSLLGKTAAEADELLTASTAVEASPPAVTFTEVRVASRGDVVIRPVITEIIYVIGQVFLRLLKMLVVPLVIVTVLVGIASLGDIRKLGRMGLQTAGFFLLTMILAVITGVTLVNIIQPGRAIAESGAWITAEPAISDQSWMELILKTIPTNPIQAIAELDIVGILFFVIFLAIAMLKLGKRKAAPVFNFFESMNDIIFVLIEWVMILAPIGVGALVAHTVATQEYSFIAPLLVSLGKFALTVVLALIVHWFVIMTLLATLARYSPILFVKNFFPAMATAFGTSSSSATLPVTMSCVDNLGVSRRIRNFVLPIGATVQMDGTALFEAIAVLFFAQAFGADLGWGGQFTVAIVSVVAAIGAAGIPSAGLVTMVIVLSAVGLPSHMMQVLWAVDRPLDMLRTVTNVTGDAVTSRFIQTINPQIRPEEDELYEEYAEIEPEASHGE